MSTSIHEGVYLYDPTEFGADRFVDTGLARDGVLNSAMHRADSAAQPRAIWSAPKASLWTDDSDPWLVPAGDGTAGAMDADVWYRFPIHAVFAPKVRANGAGYRLRVSVGGRSSAGGSVDFAVIVKPYGRSAFEYWGVFGSWPSKTYSGVTSTTVAMLTADDATRWVDPGRDVITSALGASTWSTLTDIGGDYIALRMPVLDVAIYGRTTNVLSTPELHLFCVQEVIGT